MKKTRILALVSALVILVLALPMAAMAEYTAYVNTPNGRPVNARSSMITHCNNRVDSLPDGFAVTVMSTNGDWSYVQFYHTQTHRVTKAYIQSRYLTQNKGAIGSDVKDLQMISPRTGTVVPASPTGWVNMRASTSKSSKVLGQYRQGRTLTVTAVGSTWVAVYDPSNGTSGYMMRKFIRF